MHYIWTDKQTEITTLYIQLYLNILFCSFHSFLLRFKNSKNIYLDLKFRDGDEPNLCTVKKYMLVPHLWKIYFGLG